MKTMRASKVKWHPQCYSIGFLPMSASVAKRAIDEKIETIVSLG